MRTQKQFRVFLIGLLLFGCGQCRYAFAESYTVPLEFIVKPSAHGNFASAPFNFGREFSQISSVRLNFVMTERFEGFAYTTGNSTGFHTLEFVIQDQGSVLDESGNFDPYYTLHSTSFGIPVGSAAMGFGGHSISFDDTPPASPSWPAFLMGGTGELDIIDLSSVAFHPIGGTEFSYSQSWSAPASIQTATLTIEVSSVPEPHTLLLAAVGLLPHVSRRRGPL